jgi:hypothetical protein
MGIRKRNAPGRTVSLWTDFEQVYPVRIEDDTPVDLEDGETYWQNSFYTVMRKELEPERGMDGAVLLTIARRDGKAVRNSRHLQRIKNELTDPEREGAEVFPPESMVTDDSNRSYLFVTPVGVASIYVYEAKMRQGLSPYDAVRITEDAE